MTEIEIVVDVSLVGSENVPDKEIAIVASPTFEAGTVTGIVILKEYMISVGDACFSRSSHLRCLDVTVSAQICLDSLDAYGGDCASSAYAPFRRHHLLCRRPSTTVFA